MNSTPKFGIWRPHACFTVGRVSVTQTRSSTKLSFQTGACEFTQHGLITRLSVHTCPVRGRLFKFFSAFTDIRSNSTHQTTFKKFSRILCLLKRDQSSQFSSTTSTFFPSFDPISRTSQTRLTNGRARTSGGEKRIEVSLRIVFTS